MTSHDISPMWVNRWMSLALYISTWSKDPSTKVGAVLVAPEGLVAIGYNKFPESHSEDDRFYNDREYKYAHIIHAEEMVLSKAPERLEGYTLFSTFPVCPNCMEKVAKTGLRRIIQGPLYTDGRDEKWVKQWLKWCDQSAHIAKLNVISVNTFDYLHELKRRG